VPAPLAHNHRVPARRRNDERLYAADLAFIHNAAFGEFARRTAPEIIRILRRAGISSGLLVEAGCGSGILASRLTGAGYELFGFDQSPAMIRMARASAPRAILRVASLARAAIPPCRAVVAAGEVISYVRRREAAAFIRRVHAALEARGLFLFDFIESGVHRTYPPRMIAGDGWSLVAGADLDASGRVLTRRLAAARDAGGGRCRRTKETHRVRIYSRKEIARTLSAAGFAFTMRRRYGRYRLLPGDVVVIARKRSTGRTL
jgi:2-polyprenyl-3-methyl-5-hydroxy-6-metoxy-1,4-benzoquinol methylase